MGKRENMKTVVRYLLDHAGAGTAWTMGMCRTGQWPAGTYSLLSCIRSFGNVPAGLKYGRAESVSHECRPSFVIRFIILTPDRKPSNTRAESCFNPMKIKNGFQKDFEALTAGWTAARLENLRRPAFTPTGVKCVRPSKNGRLENKSRQGGLIINDIVIHSLPPCLKKSSRMVGSFMIPLLNGESANPTGSPLKIIGDAAISLLSFKDGDPHFAASLKIKTGGLGAANPKASEVNSLPLTLRPPKLLEGGYSGQISRQTEIRQA